MSYELSAAVYLVANKGLARGLTVEDPGISMCYRWRTRGMGLVYTRASTIHPWRMSPLRSWATHKGRSFLINSSRCWINGATTATPSWLMLHRELSYILSKLSITPHRGRISVFA